MPVAAILIRADDHVATLTGPVAAGGGFLWDMAYQTMPTKSSTTTAVAAIGKNRLELRPAELRSNFAGRLGLSATRLEYRRPS